MSQFNVFTALVGVVLLVVFFEMLRRRQLREKYAVLWIVIALGVVPLAAFPQGLDWVADSLDVASGASLVLFLGLVLLLLICIHLSWEVSQLEEETRTLAEEIALIRTQLEERSVIPERDPPATAPEIQPATAPEIQPATAPEIQPATAAPTVDRKEADGDRG
jgi:hypothetical protein